VVIKFDLSSAIPEDAEIKEAVLSFFFTTGTIGNKYTTAYRLIREWDVSTVTWMNAGSNVPWTLPGGDYSEENAAKTDYVPDSSWEHYDVTDIVQLFIHGTANYGFLIEADPASGNKNRSYCASEYMDSDSLRPKLTITYTSNAIITSTPCKNLFKGILLRKNGSTVRLFIPFEKQYQLSLFNSGGKIIETVSGSKSRWYQLQAATPSSGIYFMQLCMDGKTVGGKVILMK
jgi:hypothetical protein